VPKARGVRLGRILRRSTGLHRPVFVDSRAFFQYSKGLARCCACGLGVLTRIVLVEA